MTPEQQARQQIDAKLGASDWIGQDYKAFDPSVGRGIPLPLLNVVEELESLVIADLQRATHLRQSILQLSL
jgi:hypothetical protein